MAAPQQITLFWNSAASAGGGSKSRVYDIYGCNPHSVELFRKNQPLLNGWLSDWNVGYRSLIQVDFKTLDADKTDLFNLYDFMYGTNRAVFFEGTSWSVEPVEDGLDFQFFEDSFFANALTLHFIQSDLQTIADTGITRTLVPLYTPAGQGISGADGQVLSIYVNLVDDSSIQVHKSDFQFINRDRGDYSAGYRHKLGIDFGPVIPPEWRQWLLEFSLWNNREIDTTQIDPLNGKVYQVVLDGEELIWDFEQGIRNALSTKMTFLDKVLRVETEVPILPTPETPPIWDEIVYDEKKTW